MYFEDIQRDGISIGMFGWSDPLTTQGHGKSITIRMVYIEPDYRGNFNEIVKHIMEVCKKAEVETIQMYATKEVSNWFRRLGYDPKGYLHIYKPQEILNSLSAENQEVA
jgi:N-acetylglutamate synthase-like GNAT family acetyltransferase